MLTFPHIDPVAIDLGVFVIRWYSLAYIAGILLGWLVVRHIHKKHPIENLTSKAIEDMIMWAVLGIMLGGRLGYILFYKLDYYLANPAHIFMLWEGGMSFHGGMLGMILAFYLFARRRNIPYLKLMDAMAVAAPIGLFLGRIANFINGELYGRITDSPLGMVFPNGGDLPRYPSQLFQAGMEGLALGLTLWILYRHTNAIKKPGVISGVFLIGYSLARMTGELFREPDPQLGFLFAHVTMGQLLSLPMLLLGVYLVVVAQRKGGL